MKAGCCGWMLRLQLRRQRGGVEWAGTPECDKIEIAGVYASGDRQLSDRVGHHRVGDIDRAARQFRWAETDLASDSGESALGGSNIKQDRPTESRVGRDSTEEDVGIGDRRAVATTPVTCGAWRSPGRLGPDSKAARFDVDDRSAPSTARVDRD